MCFALLCMQHRISTCLLACPLTTAPLTATLRAIADTSVSVSCTATHVKEGCVVKSLACLDEQAALVARTRKRYSEAVEHYSAAIELRLLTCQYKATLYNERALTNYHLGHHLEVIWDCHMSLALNPPALLPMCIRGRSFTELGYFSHALVVRRSYLCSVYTWLHTTSSPLVRWAAALLTR